MTRGRIATTINTLLLRYRSRGNNNMRNSCPKGVMARCMNSKVARREEYYDVEAESFEGNHKQQEVQNDQEENHMKLAEEEGRCWVPDARTGIYYPKGQEWVMKDVPDGAASFDFNYWFRNGTDGHGI